MTKPMTVPIVPAFWIHLPDETTQPHPIIAPNATTRISVELITFLNLFFSIEISPFKLPHIQIRLYVTSCSFQHIVSITRRQTPHAESLVFISPNRI